MHFCKKKEEGGMVFTQKIYASRVSMNTFMKIVIIWKRKKEDNNFFNFKKNIHLILKTNLELRQLIDQRATVKLEDFFFQISVV